MNTINKSLKEAIEAKIGTAIPMLNSRDLQVKASAVVPPAYLDAIDSHDRWSERFKKQCEEVVEQHKDVLDFEDKDRIEGNKPVIAEEPVKIKDQKITESLKENYQDFVFTVKCNDGPKEIVRVVAEDRSKAEEYAKNMYSQNHTTYADDRNNVWTIEEGNQLKEALHGMNEIDQFVKMANAIGLKTMGDVKNFLDREGDGKDILTALYDYLYHEIGDLEFQVEDESLKESYLDNIKNPDYWQHQVDYQIEKFGRVGGGLIQDLDEAGFYLDANERVQSKSVESKEECLTEDTIKQDGKWINKGEEGTHGEFDTKKEADAQRKAMFANGYKENLTEDIEEATEEEEVKEPEAEVKINLEKFKPWGKAVDTYTQIQEAGKMEDFERVLEEGWPDGIKDQTLNELLIEDIDWIAEVLDMEFVDKKVK